MASGLLSLKWNHHRSTFLHVLANIRQKESYCDVTLACDGKFYSAHKLVLSTCSEYFEGMFERTQCKHPVIVLKDIGSDELEALLSYMYDGEVNVLQENLSSLIKAAECLKIKGLAVADHDPTEQPKEKNSIKDSSRSHSSSNNNLHGDTSSNSSRQFRNSNSSTSGGLKRQNFSNKQEDSQPIKRRRPDQQQSSGNIVASSPVHRPVRSSSSDSKSAVSDARDLNPATPNKVDDDPQTDAPENSLDAASAGPSAVDDQVSSDVPDDARSFAQGLSDDTGVKAEPVEIIDSDDMGSYDHQADDRHDVSDAEFTEEKFSGGGANNDDPNSLWGNPGDAADLFSQPSTSTFSGGDGGDPNGGGSAAASGGSKAGGSAAPGPMTVEEFSRCLGNVDDGTYNLSRRAPTCNRDHQLSPTTTTAAQQPVTMDRRQQQQRQMHPATSAAPPNFPLHQLDNLPLPFSAVSLNSIISSQSSYMQGSVSPSSTLRHPLTSDSEDINISIVKDNLDTSNLQAAGLSASAGGFRKRSSRSIPRINSLKPETLAFLVSSAVDKQINKCPYCDYTSNRKDNYTIHLRRHAGDNPFVCSFCTKGFASKPELSMHIKFHTGEKNFQCTYCPYVATRKAVLRIHVQNRHPGLNYSYK